MNVVFSVRNQERQRREMFDNLTMGLRLGEALEKFLQYQSSAKHRSCFQRTPKLVNLRNIGRYIAPQRQRPDGCIDQYVQSRDRSFL